MSELNVLLVEHPETRIRNESYHYKTANLVAPLYLYGDYLSVARPNLNDSGWDVRAIEAWGIFDEPDGNLEEAANMPLTPEYLAAKAHKNNTLSLESLQNLYSKIENVEYYPIFDEKMQRAYDEFADLRLAHLSREAIKRSQEATLGAVAIMNTVDTEWLLGHEVFEQKVENMTNLVRFRKHIRDTVFSQVSDVDNLWDINKANRIYQSQLRVGIEEHTERLIENSYFSNLGAEYLGNPRPWVENVFAVLLAEAWNISTRQSLGAIAIMSTSHFVKAGWDKHQHASELGYSPFHYLDQLAKG